MPDSPTTTPNTALRTIVVKRPFTFHRTINGAVIPRRFEPGVYSLDPTDEDDRAFLQHPWIARDNADGRIESQQEAQARKQAAESAQREARERAAALAAEAAQNAAYARASTPLPIMDTAAFEREMNTPINMLPKVVGGAL